MKPKFQVLLIAIVCACALLILTSCSAELGVGRVRGPVAVRQGPPAHAPAHGYRRKHVGDAELVYDSGCGVYVVVGSPHHYYYNDRFYRLSGAEWQVSLTLDSGWVRISDDRLPPGLRKNKVAKANHGRGPKKIK
jgi:hypothetical protein